MNSVLILFVLLLMEFTFPQKISFLYSTISYNTSCRSVLIHNQDSILFKSRISIFGNYETFESLQYEIKGPEEKIETLCLLEATKCQNQSENSLYTEEPCLCQISDDKDIFTTLRVKAMADFSEQNLRLKLVYANKSIYSPVLRLPHIYDISKSNFSIYINNKLADNANCNETIHSADVSIITSFDVTKDIPCRTEILRQNAKVIAESDSNSLKFSTKLYNTEFFKITFKICEMQEYIQSVTCTLHRGFQTNENKTQLLDTMETVQIILCLLLLLVFSSIALLYTLKIFKRNFFYSIEKCSQHREDYRQKHLSKSHEDYLLINPVPSNENINNISNEKCSQHREDYNQQHLAISYEDYLLQNSVSSNEHADDNSKKEFNIDLKKPAK